MAYLELYNTNGQKIVKILAYAFKSGSTNDLVTIGANALNGGATAAQVYQALFDASTVQAAGFTSYGQTSTTSAFLTELVDNLTFGTSISASTKATYVTNLTPYLSLYATRGAFADALFTALEGLTTTDADLTAIKNVMANRAEMGAYYAHETTAGGTFDSMDEILGVTATITDSAASVTAAIAGTSVSGQIFTLTTAPDSLTGTSGNDTFVALVDAQTTTNSTLTAVDTINGSSGTGDALNITTQGTAAVADAVNSALVSGIETVNLRATSTAGVTMAAGNVSGVTLINNNLSTDAVTLTGLASTTALKITGNGNVVNGATTATYSASATTGAVTLDGGLTAGAVAVNGAGFTSFTVNSTGAKNVIGALSSSGTSIAATTINAAVAFETSGLTVGTLAAGGQTLTISGAAADRSATSSAVAKSSVKLGALDADYVTIDASGLTAGGVEATLSATTTATFTGGAGSDRITTSTTGQTGSVDAGAGTDTLNLANTVDIDSTAEGAIYKGFEVLGVANAVSIDMDTITGSTITSVVVTDAGGATVVTDMSATQAAAVTIAAGDGALTLGRKSAGTVGNLDTITITVSDGDTTGSEACVTAGDFTIAGVETINITATDDITLATMANITGLTALTVTGGGDVSITTLVHVASANESVNFAGLTAASTFNFAGTTTNAIAFTGGSGIDTVTDSVVGGNVISTGAGRDVITLTAKTAGSSGDSITSGAGGDSIVVTAAKGNATIEKITLKFAAGDSVADSSVAGTGFVAATMDAVTGIDLATAAAAAAGHVITFDTVESATAQTWASTAVTFGTTAVTNAYDFYIYNTGAGGITYVYQDTDGDKLIETGEFAIQLTGVAATASASAEFAVSSGNLVLTTAVG